MKYTSFVAIIAVIFAHPANSQQAYFAKRYDTLVDQYISMLEARRKMLDQKIQSSRSFQTQTEKRLSEKLSTARAGSLKKLSDLNKSAVENMQATQMDLQNRVLALRKEKADAEKKGIKDSKEEEALIRSITRKQAVIDLEERINEVKREEQALVKQAGEGDTRAVASIVAQRKALELKLSTERAKLIK